MGLFVIKRLVLNYLEAVFFIKNMITKIFLIIFIYPPVLILNLFKPEPRGDTPMFVGFPGEGELIFILIYDLIIIYLIILLIRLPLRRLKHKK